MKKSLNIFAILAATALTPVAASAATIDGSYDVTAAVSERNGTAFSLWFIDIMGAGLSNVFEIVTPGSLVVDATSGQLDASTVASTGSAGGFDIAMSFDRDFSDNVDTTPEFKSVWADVFEHGNEGYLDLEYGTLTGTGGLAGLDFEIVRAPASGEVVTQLGGGIDATIGANQHNSNFGISGWFTISAVSLDRNTCSLCSFDDAFYNDLIGRQGDINMDLTPLAEAPIPAAGLMLLAALAGGGAIARRRKG